MAWEMVKWIVLAAQTWEIEQVWILSTMELPNLIIGVKGRAEIDGFWNLLASQPHQNTELQFHKDPDNSGIRLEKNWARNPYLSLGSTHEHTSAHTNTPKCTYIVICTIRIHTKHIQMK